MTTAETLLDQGFEHHQRGRFVEAESLYRKLLMHQPHHVDGLHLLGLVHHQTGRAADAIGLIEQAIAAKGVPCPILLTNLGAAYQECRQWDRAEECYRQAILLDKAYVNAHQNLCRLLTMQGQTLAAASAWAGFGNLMLDNGKAAEALVHFRMAQELFPDQPSVLHDLATALARLHRLDESVSAYRAALAKDNRSAMAWNNLGWVLLQLAQSQQAIDKFDINNAIAIFITCSPAHFSLIAGSWFPGSAWEPHELQALPAVVTLNASTAGGRASKTVRSQAEPGNEHVRTGDQREVSVLFSLS